MNETARESAARHLQDAANSAEWAQWFSIATVVFLVIAVAAHLYGQFKSDRDARKRIELPPHDPEPYVKTFGPRPIDDTERLDYVAKTYFHEEYMGVELKTGRVMIRYKPNHEAFLAAKWTEPKFREFIDGQIRREQEEVLAKLVKSMRVVTDGEVGFHRREATKGLDL